MQFVADKVVSYTRENDGGTFLLPHMFPLAKSAKVYVLSVDDEHGVVVPYTSFGPTRLNQWLLNGHEKFIEQWNSRVTNYDTLKALGTWVDDGSVYIDVVTMFSKDEFSLETIMEIARDNHQRAIWDNELQVALETGWMP